MVFIKTNKIKNSIAFWPDLIFLINIYFNNT